uniref:Uncharacterized protein n=1 Tax=Anopheles culicifacies TaxID=139723 RepID=A0A182MWA1_9DIPT
MSSQVSWFHRYLPLGRYKSMTERRLSGGGTSWLLLALILLSNTGRLQSTATDDRGLHKRVFIIISTMSVPGNGEQCKTFHQTSLINMPAASRGAQAAQAEGFVYLFVLA